LPQAEGDRGQLDAAATAAAVGHWLIPVRGGNVGHEQKSATARRAGFLCRRYSSGWRAMPPGSRPASSQPRTVAASGRPTRITSRLVTGILVSDDRPSSELL